MVTSGGGGKVLRIIRSMNPAQGGVAEAVNQAALSFNNKKWQMDVLCLDKPNAPWVLENNNYTIYALDEGKTAYGFHLGYLLWLWKNAKNYDMVIIDGLWQFLVFGGYVLKALNIPYCVFIHGMLSPYFNSDKIKYIKKLPFWFAIERNVIALAEATIFTCDEERKLAVKSLPFYQGVSRVVTHGVDGILLPSNTLINNFLSIFSVLKNKQIILYLGRIHVIKGIDLLIDALGQLKSLPDNFMLAIAGPDSNGLQAKLSQQIESLGLTERVVWLGMLSGDTKWGAYHAADVFILPSHQENFGIVVAEALSTSTPVLITNKVNIWREVDSTGAGFVENDDVNGIEILLKKWLGLSGYEKNAMNIKAKLCYENNFSMASAVSDLEKVLFDVSKPK